MTIFVNWTWICALNFLIYVKRYVLPKKWRYVRLSSQRITPMFVCYWIFGKVRVIFLRYYINKYRMKSLNYNAFHILIKYLLHTRVQIIFWTYTGVSCELPLWLYAIDKAVLKVLSASQVASILLWLITEHLEIENRISLL